MTKLDKFPGKLLYVARGVSPKVIEHLQLTAQNVDEFNRLRKARGGLKLAHGLMYLMISMTALLAAIWVGLWFAGRFVAPIRRLIAAAQEVSTGNLMIELPEKRGEGDLRRLSKTFNTMTRELKHQRDALVTANEQLLERRHFMEAVLSGVSAGVIGLDSQDRITLVSRAAGSLLGLVESDLVGKKLKDAIPVFGAVLDKKDEHTLKGRSLEEVTFTVGGEERTFAVMVTRERASGGDVGSVVTFDDVTDLVVAQRTAAWADVARRIAHEIKNPLTPIQLAAERLRKKYAQDHHQRPRDLRPPDDDDRAPGRRPQGDGRRVRRVRAHAQARDGAPRSAPRGAGAGRAVSRGPSRDPIRAQAARQADPHVVRPPPHHAGGHQPRQERQRGHRGGARIRRQGRTAGRDASRRSSRRRATASPSR